MSVAEATPVAHDSARTDAELVLAARGAEPGAYGELFQRWYDRCFDLAWNVVRDREAAADVAQDAFLAGWEKLPDLRDPAAFGGWILRIARNRALHRLERDKARPAEPIDAQPEERVAVPDTEADPAVLAGRRDSRHLVWLAAAALGARDTSLLDLHLRHGLEPAEIASELKITPNHAHQLLFRLRGKLRDTIGAALLWREGRPTCQGLAPVASGSGGFDASTAAAIRQHQRLCGTCSGELRQQTNPELLFASVPVAIAPLLLKTSALQGLLDAGVPMLAGGGAVAATASAASGAGAAGGQAVTQASGGGVTGMLNPGEAIRAAVAKAGAGPLLAAGALIIAITGGVAAVHLFPLGPRDDRPARDQRPVAEAPVSSSVPPSPGPTASTPAVTSEASPAVSPVPAASSTTSRRTSRRTTPATTGPPRAGTRPPRPRPARPRRRGPATRSRRPRRPRTRSSRPRRTIRRTASPT